MTKICPNCQAKNEDNSDFCQKCGKKIPKTVKIPKQDTPPRGGLKGWWDKQNSGVKIISIIGGCCLGVIIILVVMSALFPVTSLILEKNDVLRDNLTVQYILKGETDINAKVYISSTELNLNNTEVRVDENGKFEYRQQLPKNLTELSVSITAKAPNKSQKEASLMYTKHN